jgi:putative peptidoglycan lipid II flippase
MDILFRIAKEIQKRWSKIPLHHVEIIRGGSWLILFIGVGKLAGLLKEVIIAAELGVGPEMDIFLLAMTLSTMLVGPVAHTFINCLSTSYAEWGTRHLEKGFQEFQGTINIFVILCAGGLLVIQHISLPYLPKIFSIELVENSLEKLVNYSRLLNTYIVLSLLLAMASTRLLMRKKQINTLLETLPALCTITACLLWNQKVDGWTLITGFLVGNCLQILVLNIFLGDVRFIFCFHWKITSEIKIFLQRFCWMLPAQVLTTSTVLVDQIMASWLGSGSISTLGYATRILAILLTLTQTVIGRAILPVFGEMRARPDVLKKTVNQWVMISLVGGSALSLIMGYYAENIITILFERGEFSSEETNKVKNVLWAYLVQTPFYLSVTIIHVEKTILGKQKNFVMYSLIMFSSNLILNFLLTYSLGVAGIALSTSISYAILLLLMIRK